MIPLVYIPTAVWENLAELERIKAVLANHVGDRCSLEAQLDAYRIEWCEGIVGPDGPVPYVLHHMATIPTWRKSDFSMAGKWNTDTYECTVFPLSRDSE